MYFQVPETSGIHTPDNRWSKLSINPSSFSGAQRFGGQYFHSISIYWPTMRRKKCRWWASDTFLWSQCTCVTGQLTEGAGVERKITSPMNSSRIVCCALSVTSVTFCHSVERMAIPTFNCHHLHSFVIAFQKSAVFVKHFITTDRTFDTNSTWMISIKRSNQSRAHKA